MISVKFEGQDVLDLKNEMQKFLLILGGEFPDSGDVPDNDDNIPDPVDAYLWLDKYVGYYEKEEPQVKALWRIIPNLKTKYGKNRVALREPRYDKQDNQKFNPSGRPILLQPKETNDKTFLYPGDVFWGWRRSFQADSFRGKEICEPALTAMPEIFVELVGELRDGEFIEA